MKEQGVRQDDPEYLKAHNLLTAISQQQQFARQRQAYAQQQQQAQHRQQQQQNGGSSQAATNGIKGMLVQPTRHPCSIDSVLQDVLLKLLIPPPPPFNHPRPLPVRLLRLNPQLLLLVQRLVHNPANHPRLVVPVSAQNSYLCFEIKSWPSSYSQRILLYHQMSNNNSSLLSTQSGLLRRLKLSQRLVKCLIMRLKLEIVPAWMIQGRRSHGRGTTRSSRLTSTWLQVSATRITGSGVEGQ